MILSLSTLLQLLCTSYFSCYNTAFSGRLRAMFGILAAIDLLHEAGFVQRDIKGDNILIGEDGRGILVDFGLCIARADACLPEFLGDGTADYAAPEISSKLSGSTLCTELYSWFVVFVEAVMMRHPFAGEVRQAGALCTAHHTPCTTSRKGELRGGMGRYGGVNCFVVDVCSGVGVAVANLNLHLEPASF